MTTKIYLYGIIDEWGENSAAAFTERFQAAQRVADEIELHIHCYGGNVFEGNLIYNLLKNSVTPVDVYIDGVAASMGTIVMLPARRIYMSENAFIMIHSPAGTVWDGTAKEMTQAANLLTALESIFQNSYIARTGKSQKEVEAWMDGDNWFSAQQAMEAKLIDGIVDPLAPEVSEPQPDEMQNIKPLAMYNRFAAKLTIPKNNTNKTKTKMDKDAIIARYGLTGVTNQSSEADIYAAIDAKLAAKEQQNTALQAQLNAKEGEAIDSTIEATAVAKGLKFTAEQKKNLRTIGEKSGLDSLKAALDMMQPKASIVSALGGNAGGVNGADRSTWDWDKWQKEDAKGLEAYAKSNPDDFQALYDAKFRTKK